MRFIWLWACLAGLLSAATLHPIDFEVVKKEVSKSPTLLIIGGIQGDEPGGFNATNIFLNHYTIKNGSVWVVPVLNPHSMLLNHRGIYDDMNRKFAALSPNDPEKPLIEHIKSVIKEDQVQAVLHLHDGSGYYRPSFESKLANPNRWGNCTVIDQVTLEGAKYGALESIANAMIAHINAHLLAPIHRYHLHNTQTAEKDKEMQKALTFYAINQGKPGYANEASKELNVAQRVYYHLLAIDALLTQMGIEFERDFTLTPNNVQKAIKDRSQTFRLENLPEMPLFGLRTPLASFPIPKGKKASEITITSSNKILGLLPRDGSLTLKYGNNVMTKILPKRIDFYQGSLAPLEATIDKQARKIVLGERVQIAREISLPGTIALDDKRQARVQVVGLIGKDSSHITKASLSPSASLDTAGKLYRAEVYIQEKLNTEESANTPESSSAQKIDSSIDSSDSSAGSAASSSVRVSVNLANIRARAGVDSSVVGIVRWGRELEVLESVESTQEKWLKVRYIYTSGTQGREQGDEIVGYILASLTKPNDSSKLAQVRVNLAHIRAEPSTSAAIVAKAPRGRTMEVRSTKAGLDSAHNQQWAQIHYVYGSNSTKRDINGYILASLLAPLESSAPSAKPRTSPKPRPSAPKPKTQNYKESFGGMILLEFVDKSEQ